jgi:hypothetical protein
MRYTIAGLAVLLVHFNAAAYAQVPCSPVATGFDPYNPSDLAVIRQYGATALAQAPLSALLQLDPYVPIQGELQRQLGSAIPLPFWGYPWYPHSAPVPDCRPTVEQTQALQPSPRPITTFADVMGALARERGTTGAVAARAATPSTSRSTASTRKPERNTGVSLQFAGRTWISDGAAVPVVEGEFVQIGESAGFPVFRRRNTKDNVIYVPTTEGLVAPFRMGR